MKKICITGINGQLSQYLAKYLIEKEPDCQIIGTLRHKTSRKETYIFDTSKVIFELMDLSDAHSIENLIVKYKPDYFINTAANAFVGESWAVPEQHFQLNCLGVLHQLEAIRKHSPFTRYFNMGTSEEFAVNEKTEPQGESTLIAPRSPYGASKAASRFVVKVWRESYNLYALQGWTFNFESPLRDEKYFPRKISKGVARIYHAMKNNKSFEPIEVGNLNSYRSWQHASDVASGIWAQLNQERYIIWDSHTNLVDVIKLYPKKIKEYVLSASDTHSLKEFIEYAFEQAGIKGVWWPGLDGKPESEEYLLSDDGKLATKKYIPLVIINPKFFRPNDVTYLHGDASAIKKDLGWEPTISFEQIVHEMVKHDIEHYEITN